MKTRNICILMALVFLFVFSGCKKDDTNLTECPSDGSANFPYLKVGHQMSFYTEGFFVDDTITFTIDSKPSAGSYLIKSTSKNGSGASLLQDIYWHACSKDLYTSTNGNYNQLGHWWISLDANVGDTWTRTNGTSTYEYQLFSKNATVVTYGLGQTFTNCYKFTFHDVATINTDTIYFKPDVGIVNYEGMLINYELIDKNF